MTEAVPPASPPAHGDGPVGLARDLHAFVELAAAVRRALDATQQPDTVG